MENDPDFSTADAVIEVTIKPAAKYTVELPVSEVGIPSSSLFRSVPV